LENAMVVDEDKLIAVYSRNVINIIEIHNLTDGKYIESVDIPVGTVSGISGQRNGNDFFYKVQTFLTPETVYRIVFSNNTITNNVSEKNSLNSL